MTDAAAVMAKKKTAAFTLARLQLWYEGESPWPKKPAITFSLLNSLIQVHLEKVGTHIASITWDSKGLPVVKQHECSLLLPNDRDYLRAFFRRVLETSFQGLVLTGAA